MVYTGLAFTRATMASMRLAMASTAASTAACASSRLSRPWAAARASMPAREALVSPNWARPSRLQASMSATVLPPAARQGPSRCGPVRTVPLSTVICESPPMPMDSTCTARTRVGRSSMLMPSRSSRGWPSANRAMSVVVPPMSSMSASVSAGTVARMPITEAAGPEKIDCTGVSRARASGMVPPSALRMFTSASRSNPLRLRPSAAEKARKVRHTAEL